MYNKAQANAAEETEKLIVRIKDGFEEDRENNAYKESSQ